MKIKTRDSAYSLVAMSVWCLIALQIVLGILLALRYSPGINTAHQSVSAMRNNALFSSFASIHYWASAICLFLAWTNVLILLWGGRFSRSDRWLWWGAICLAVVLLAFQMTGNLLPLSYHDARTAMAEAQIAGSAPNIGSTLFELALGGNTIGQATIDRWYLTHRIILPVIVVVLAMVGLRSAREGMPAGRNKWLIIVPMLIAIIVGIIVSAPFGQGATTADLATGSTKAMWYVLPLHSLLLTFSNWNATMGWVGAILFPSLLLLIDALLPAIFKTDGISTRAFGRFIVAACAVVLALQIVSYGSGVQSPFDEPKPLPKVHVGESPVKPIDKFLARRGDKLFHSGPCKNCHSVTDNNRQNPGPLLQGIGRKHPDSQYFIDLIRNPASKGLSRMPAFADMPQDELLALAEYLRSLK